MEAFTQDREKYWQSVSLHNESRDFKSKPPPSSVPVDRTCKGWTFRKVYDYLNKKQRIKGPVPLYVPSTRLKFVLSLTLP